jgi:LysM repeat protein
LHGGIVLAKGYRPYTTDRQGKGRGLKIIMLALIVVIAGLVILIKTQRTPKPVEQQQTTPPTVSLRAVQPPSRPVVAPVSEVSPAIAAPAVQVPVEPVTPIPAGQTSVPTDSSVTQVPSGDTVPAIPVNSNTEQAPVEEEAMDKTSLEAQQLIEKALGLRDKGKLIAARDLLNEALNMKLSPQVRSGVKLQLAKLSETWLFGREVLEGDKMTGYYLVQSGDLLAKIGKQHKVPFEALQKINSLQRPESLQAGRKIKVIHGPFNAVVNRTTFTMDLYLQNVYVKSYKVGLGRSEHTTPTGRWIVAPGGKMIKPTWTDPDSGKTYVGSDPDYPLGSRWIALEGIEGDAKGRTGFALHGTKEPDTIGTQSSRGCIRLFNGDVIEVYDLMEPGQSGVIVMD